MRTEEAKKVVPAPNTMDPIQVRQQLERVLRSGVFERAQRSHRFLQYVVEAALSSQPDGVKEYTIALEVFDRDPSYDPTVNATVRVEAGRLRTRLREYYSSEGRDDSVLIEIPRGRYTPVFSYRESTTSVDLPPSPLDERPNAAAEDSHLATARSLVRGLLLPVLVVILVALIGSVIAWNRLTLPHQRQPAAASPTALAILPILNETGDPALEYLSTGLTDSLIRQLSEVPALKLIAHDTVFRFRNRQPGIRAIGQTLGVANIITASLRRTDNRLMVDAELSRVDDGSVIFSREYLAEGLDVRLIQASIARDTLRKLQAETSALNPSRPTLDLTKSPEAYQEFLKGDYLVGQTFAPQVHEGLAHFEKAVRLDPAFDLAWSSLASAHALLGLYFESPREHMNVARGFAERAIQLNPKLGEAHAILGLIHLLYDWDSAAAETELVSAGAEKPAVIALPCTAHLLSLTSRPEGAEEILRRVLSFDPQSAALVGELGCIHYYCGRYDAAIQDYREALRLSPHSPLLCWGLAKSLNQRNRSREALATLRQFKRESGFEPPLISSEIGYALAALGDNAGAVDVIRNLHQASRSAFVDPYFTSIIYLAMDDRKSAFEWLDRAFDARSGFMISILSEPKWRAVRSDPRFSKVVSSMFQGQQAR